MNEMPPTQSALDAMTARAEESPSDSGDFPARQWCAMNAAANPHSNPPLWFELLQKRTAMHAATPPAGLQVLGLNQLHHVICGLSFMAELPEDLRVKVASVLINVSKLRQAHKGDTWIHEHERAGDKGYVLLRGKARVQMAETPDGICPAPDLIGEAMQFNPMHECIATVSAAGECVVMQFAWHDFWARMQEASTEEEQRKVWAALENLAWDHLTKPLHIPSQSLRT
jgi:hypothetical protein